MAWSVGIDLGGTNIAVGLVSEDYRIVDREHEKTLAPRSAASLAETMAGCVFRLLERNRLQLSELAAIGLGLPGMVQEKTGLMIEAANLGLYQIDFASLFHPYFPHTPLKISNDGDCAIWGEFLAGEARERESVLMLTLGTGIGGGFVCDHRIFRGASGLGIEPGHMVVETEGARLCTCGRHGCLEMYASIRGLNLLIREGMQEDPLSSLHHAIKPDNPSHNVRIFFDQVHSEDAAALRILGRYTAYLASGIRSLSVLYRPHLILLGGGISNAGDLLLKPLRETLDPDKTGDYILSLPPVAVSRLGNDAGIIGAAMLHLESPS